MNSITNKETPSINPITLNLPNDVFNNLIIIKIIYSIETVLLLLKCESIHEENVTFQC